MLNRRRVLLGGAAISAAAIGGGAIAVVPNVPRAHSRTLSEEGVAWLKANALPLATAEPGSGFHDLAPLRKVIGNARIVSMGEATHGTREFFQLKHRLIEYCVTELGFTIIGFEAEYGRTLAVNDYVLEGKGNAADVVAGMGFWTWDTEEVVALVEWVRAWNLAHDRKVKFYGFDMQGSEGPALHLLAYLDRVAPELAATSERSLAPLISGYSNQPGELSDAVFEGIIAQIKTVLDAFASERERWIGRSGELDWHLARQSAVTLEQYVAWSRLNDDDGWITRKASASNMFRDRCMADNVRALLDAEGPAAKALLWAHNAHVWRSAVVDAPLLGRVEAPNMGSHLHAAFGAEHVIVGFAFNQGSFQAVSTADDGKRALGNHVVGPAPAGFVDAALASTGIPLLALDLTRVPADGAVSRWMASKPWHRRIGSWFTPAPVIGENIYSVAADPRTLYDVILFVERTTASRSNPPRPPRAPFMVTDSNKEPTNLALLGGNGIPTGWHPTNYSLYSYLISIAGDASLGGRRSVRIAGTESTIPWGDGTLTQSFPAAPWHGRRLVFTAALRAEARRLGTGAQLLVHVWPKGKNAKPTLALLPDGPVRSSHWIRRSVAVDIPRNAERVQISLVVTGHSAGWFGDLALEAADSTVGVTASAHRPMAEVPSRADSLRSFQPRMIHHERTFTIS